MWTWRSLFGLSMLTATIVGCHVTRTAEATITTESVPPKNDTGATVVADSGPMPTTFAYALARITPVVGAMDASPTQVGYLRLGAKVAVTSGPTPSESCADGWYALAGGGFVCGRWLTRDANDARLAGAPTPPALDQALPYRYAYNAANGTPIYRWIPPMAERVRYESWLAPGPTEVTGDDAPWYAKDWDGGKPQVKLDELVGEGPVARRMVKGFAVAVDVNAPGTMWKTTNGQFVPKGRLWFPDPLTDFHGVWLGGEAAPAWPPAIAQGDGGAPPYWVANPPSAMPLAFVVKTKSNEYALTDTHDAATATFPLVRSTPYALTGQTAAIGGATYVETSDRFWLRDGDAIVVKRTPASVPRDLAPGEKWIDVDVSTQTLVAFVGEKPVFATLVSTGKSNHETPRGTFRIREKHVAQTMAGDGANDGVYSIEDVPWIMYFEGGYALHGAFWHSNFGHKQSHGCVNLSPADARAMFDWTLPRVPEGWHGATATIDQPGTRVVIHD